MLISSRTLNPDQTWPGSLVLDPPEPEGEYRIIHLVFRRSETGAEDEEQSGVKRMKRTEGWKRRSAVRFQGGGEADSGGSSRS